jgi:hypothetical protein
MVAVMNVVIVPDFVQDYGRKIQALPECQVHTLPPLLAGPRGHEPAIKIPPPADTPDHPAHFHGSGANVAPVLRPKLPPRVIEGA